MGQRLWRLSPASPSSIDIPPESQRSSRATCDKLNSSEDSTASSQSTGSISIGITHRNSCRRLCLKPSNHHKNSPNFVRQYDALSFHSTQAWHSVPDQASQPYPQPAAFPQGPAGKHFMTMLAVFVGRADHDEEIVRDDDLQPNQGIPPGRLMYDPSTVLQYMVIANPPSMVGHPPTPIGWSQPKQCIGSGSKNMSVIRVEVEVVVKSR